LLVGLGFIACFAIILSNRETSPRVNAQLPYHLIAERAAPAVEPAVQADAGPSASQEDRPGGESAIPSRRPSPDGAALPGTSAPPTRQSPSLPVALAEALAGLANGVERSPQLEGEPVTEHSPRSSPPERRTHVVDKGETIWKIAQRHYPGATRETVRAILAANPALKDPSRLRIGMELVLPQPDAPDEASAKPDAESAPLASGEGPPDVAEKPAHDDSGRWYEVKKGDLYSTIAQEQLGSSKRWRELFELNKDIFPDPARIQHGVRIRLPDNGHGNG